VRGAKSNRALRNLYFEIHFDNGIVEVSLTMIEKSHKNVTTFFGSPDHPTLPSRSKIIASNGLSQLPAPVASPTAPIPRNIQNLSPVSSIQ
jgi:hypothetical protein